MLVPVLANQSGLLTLLFGSCHPQFLGSCTKMQRACQKPLIANGYMSGAGFGCEKMHTRHCAGGIFLNFTNSHSLTDCGSPIAHRYWVIPRFWSPSFGGSPILRAPCRDQRARLAARGFLREFDAHASGPLCGKNQLIRGFSAGKTKKRQEETGEAARIPDRSPVAAIRQMKTSSGRAQTSSDVQETT